MLRLEHFLHVDQLDTMISQIAAKSPGLVVVAGLDPRLAVEGRSVSLSSGRATFSRILMREMMERRSGHVAVVTRDRGIVRTTQALRRRVRWSIVEIPGTYGQLIASAVHRWPDLLVVDRLTAESVAGALWAARSGVQVLSQFETVFRGDDVVSQLRELAAGDEQLDISLWVVAVCHLPMLCPHCKQPVPEVETRLGEIYRRYPDLCDLAKTGPASGPSLQFFQAAGCDLCGHTGRAGDVACFDLLHLDEGFAEQVAPSSVLPMHEYVFRMAMEGYLALADLVQLDTEQLHRTYALLTANERALMDVNATLNRKLVELDSAHRVLEQRTQALISLQSLGESLISSTSLGELATRVCRHVGELCGADRSILYYGRSPGQIEVLAAVGWTLIPHQVLAPGSLFPVKGVSSSQPVPHHGSPPGVVTPQGKSAEPMRGLCIPLVAQDEVVGYMVVHTLRRTGFLQGEMALLQAIANQAALAMQRAGLIEQLVDKIAQLEAAQAELVGKERMERELELARQVQQSVLPKAFPAIPGFAFAARNEPAREVGGDFYDVFVLDADHFGIAIADVSDKGMPAALYMALTRSLLLAEARRVLSPMTVLTNVNRLLLELGEPSMFVSVFYGVIDTRSGQLVYTRAGHDRPLLLRGKEVERLVGGGAVLGCLDEPDLHLTEERLTLVPADRLVLYTDGMIDVVSPDDRLFDLGRFVSLLSLHGHLLPGALCAAVFADLGTYRGEAEQYDDMTILVVDVGSRDYG